MSHTNGTTALAPHPLQQAIAERGVDAAAWNTLTSSLYPGAKPESVLLVLDYCRSRKLDPLKKPCHIVPMSVKDAKTGRYDWRDVVMPGIYELRTTAARTGEYRGHSKPAYGDVADFKGITAPEWCEMTIFRGPRGAQADEYPVRVLFSEVCNTDKDGKPTSRWIKAPVQMLTKCCEAAGLREAFPDELGGEHTVEEMEGRSIDAGAIDVTPVAMPQANGQPPSAGAPVTSQPEPPASAAAPPGQPPIPDTPNTAFRRDRVTVTDMEAKTTAPKVDPQTGVETPGQVYALVTLSTGETFQSWHQNLNVKLESWKATATKLDVDLKTARDTKFRPAIQSAVPA